MVTDLPDICLIGHTGAGKSTAGKILERLGYRRLGFAGVAENPHRGSPRDIVTRIWGPEAINDREKLVAMANEARRLDPDVWLRSLVRELDASSEGRWSQDGPCRAGNVSVPIVVDDCRFTNEFWGLKERGFVTVRIEAPLQQREDRLKVNGKWLSDEYLESPIEHYLDGEPADYTIYNDGTTDELADVLAAVLCSERRRR